MLSFYGLDRLLAEQAEKSCFDTDYIAAFNTRLDEILQHGRQEYEADKERLEKYGASFERALLNRVEKYRGSCLSPTLHFAVGNKALRTDIPAGLIHIDRYHLQRFGNR